MKSITPLILNSLQMKTTQLRQTTALVVAKARALGEREFARLRERQPRLLQHALNEAESIAWQTGFPQLVFPLLALEKASAVAAWEVRQQRMLSRATPGE